MPFQPGNKFGRGRERGSKNKASAAMRDLMDERYPEWNPVLAMAEIAQDDEFDLSVRVQCMKEVAGYMYPKQKAVELRSGEPQGSVEFVWGKSYKKIETDSA